MDNHANQLNQHAAGWYQFALSANIKKDKVSTFNYFDTSFVCYRSSDNRVNIFDAYCPHMGAHLGIGGKIENDLLICPFHGWKYSSAGDCVQIPYCSHIPKRARLRGYPVKELNSFIYILYQPNTADISADDDLSIIAENRFMKLISTQIKLPALEKLIAWAKSDYDFHPYEAGLLLRKFQNIYCLLATTPINKDTYTLSFSFAADLACHPLQLFSLKIRLRQQYKFLLKQAGAI
jgi:nitrite reductase/ring-hydroxylating ferredoxin subunit